MHGRCRRRAKRATRTGAALSCCPLTSVPVPPTRAASPTNSLREDARTSGLRSTSVIHSEDQMIAISSCYCDTSAPRQRGAAVGGYCTILHSLLLYAAELACAMNSRTPRAHTRARHTPTSVLGPRPPSIARTALRPPPALSHSRARQANRPRGTHTHATTSTYSAPRTSRQRDMGPSEPTCVSRVAHCTRSAWSNGRVRSFGIGRHARSPSSHAFTQQRHTRVGLRHAGGATQRGRRRRRSVAPCARAPASSSTCKHTTRQARTAVPRSCSRLLPPRLI